MIEKIFLKNRVIAFALGIILCLTTITGGTIIQLILPTKAEPVVSVAIVMTDPAGTTYNVGGLAPIAIQVSLSGLDIGDKLINPVLTLNYNTADLGTTSSTRPAINISDAPAFALKAAKTISYPTVTWPLNDLQGGTSFSIPGTISMPAGYTPNGYPLVLTATLTADGKQPITSQVTISWKTVNNTASKSANALSLSTVNGLTEYNVFAGVDADGDNKIDADKTYPVTYSWAYPQPTGYRRVTTTRKIVDYLPDAATFDQSENPDWVYNAAARTVTTTNANAKLILRFPLAAIKTDHLNKSDVTFYVEDPKFNDPVSYTVPANNYVRFTGKEDTTGVVGKSAVRTSAGTVRVGGDAYRPAVPYQVNGDYWWDNSVSNTLRMTPISNVVIEDNDLDINLKFTRFFIVAPINKADITIEYREAGSSVWKLFKTITSNQLTYSSETDTAFLAQFNGRESFFKLNNYISKSDNSRLSSIIDFPANIVVDGVRASFGNLEAGEGVKLYLCSVWRDPEFAKTLDTSITTVYDNTTKFTAGSALVANDTASQGITPYSPLVYAYDTGGLNADIAHLGTKFAGNTFSIPLVLRVENLDESDSINMNGAQIIQLLPTGLEFLPGTVTVSADHIDRLVSLEPQIIYDYKGTGKTALIWTMKGIYQSGGAETYTLLSTLTYQVKVNETCPKGTNTIEHYVTWPENARVTGFDKVGSPTNLRYYNYYKDLYDLDNDGDTTETFLYNNPTFIYDPPEAVVATKGVKGSCNSTYMYMPALGFGMENTAASYKLTVMNYSKDSVSKVKLFDVLPYVGDKALVKNNDNVFVDRGSTFAVTLTGPLVVSDPRFNVYYATANPAPWNGIDAYDGAAGWQTGAQIGSNWASVRAFKVQLKDGESLSSGEGVDIIVPVKVPQTVTEGSIAYNSFAVSSGMSSYGPWLEAPKAGLEIVNYDVGITKKADKDSYLVGDSVTYTITVKNNGKLTTTAAYVVDTIPAEVTYVSCSRASTYNATSRELRVDIGTLLGGASVQFTVTATAKTLKQSIVNTATVTINEQEKNYTNNKDTATIKIVDKISVMGAIHLRQFIRYPNGTVQPTTLPEAYVSITGQQYNEWANFGSKLDTTANYALKEYYDVVPVSLDNTYTITVLVPGGYKLVSVTISNVSESSQAAGNKVSLSGTHTDAWVTILLEKLPSGPTDEKIENHFSPVTVAQVN